MGKELKASGNTTDEQVDPWVSFLATIKDYRCWILFWLYAACFGTELVMNNVLATHFYSQFDLSLQMAGTAASLFGLMNLFARSLGGIVSDLAYTKCQMRGRLWVHFITQFLVGVTLMAFSRVPNTQFGLAIFILVLFSTSVQMAEGAEFAITPYVGSLLKCMGPVAGIVGAGGNVGAVCWLNIYKALNQTSDDA